MRVMRMISAMKQKFRTVPSTPQARLEQQAKAELKARAMENKAEYSKQMRLRLEREKKAQEEIHKLKQFKKEKRKEKIAPLRKMAKGLQSHLNKRKEMGKGINFGGNPNKDVYNASGKGIDYGGKSGGFQIGNQETPKPKQKQKTIIIKL